MFKRLPVDIIREQMPHICQAIIAQILGNQGLQSASPQGFQAPTPPLLHTLHPMIHLREDMSQPNDAEFSPAHAFAQAVSGEVFVQQSCQWHAQSRTAKLNFLATKGSIRGVEWQELHPDENYIWLTENLRPEFESSSFLPIGTKEAKSARIVEVGGAEAEAIFKEYSPGVQTNRDSWMYDFNARKLAIKAESMIETYNAELARWIR